MNAVSLWQPWASAIAVGVKTIETRSWATGYRGPLAIHAAKKWSRDLDYDARRFVRQGLKLGTPEANGEGRKLERWLPLGAVVAVAELVDCVPMTDEWIGRVSMLDRALGGYEAGRFGWVLENVRPLKDPYPMTGKQGLWTLDGPTVEALLLLAGAVPNG